MEVSIVVTSKHLMNVDAALGLNLSATVVEACSDFSRWGNDLCLKYHSGIYISTVSPAAVVALFRYLWAL